MKRGRGRALPRALRALRTLRALCALCALTALNTLSAPRASAEPPAGGEPAALRAEVEVTGQAEEIASAAQWGQALLELWQIRYGSWATQTAGELAAPLRAQLRIEGVPEGLRVRVSLQAPAGGSAQSAQSAQVVVWSSSVQAGAQAAAGELAFLLASRAGFPQPQQQPPRLASVIGVDSLELLRAGPAGPGQGPARPGEGPAGSPPRTESLAVDADPGGVRRKKSRIAPHLSRLSVNSAI